MCMRWLRRLKNILSSVKERGETADEKEDGLVIADFVATGSGLLHHDQPKIKTDLYNRKSFAKQLAHLLVLPPASPGIVVGIEGAWGSGKTTAIRYIIETLEEMRDDGPIVVEFNPWMLSGADALVEALLTELASGIGMSSGAERTDKTLKVAQKILGYAGLLRHLKYLKYVPGASFAGVAAEAVGDALHQAGEIASRVGEGADAAKKLVIDAEELVSIKSGLSQRKKEVIQALSELNRSIVVIVDDLDRLTSDEIKAVFRTIKAVADFPRVAYLLAYDKDVISESLIDQNVERGRAYIEKIVQISYPLAPAFPWQLQTHLSKAITDLFQRIQQELRTFENTIFHDAIRVASGLCRHPRDIIRITNRLTFSLMNISGEVNAADVIVAEALFQRFPKIRDAVIKNPQHYTGFRWSIVDAQQSVDWSMLMPASKDAAREAWKVSLPMDDVDKRVCIAALKFLFPIPNERTSSSAPTSDLRLSDPSRLIRYFAQTSIDGVQNIREIEQILSDPSGVGEKLNTLNIDQAKVMISHFSTYLNVGIEVKYASLIERIVTACTYERVQEDNSREFSRGVAFLVANCLEKSQTESANLMLNFVRNAPLAFGLDLLFLIGTWHGEIREIDESKVKQAVLYVNDANAVSQAIELWRERAKDAFKSKSIFKEGNIFSILYGLAKLGRRSTDSMACAALKTLCITIEGGVEFFLNSANPLREYSNDPFYIYVWNADEMARLVESSKLAEDYQWYSKSLRTDENFRNIISQRNEEQ